MNAAKQHLDVEADASNEQVGSATAPDQPVYNWCAVTGSLISCLLMAIVIVGFFDETDTKFLVKRPMINLTGALNAPESQAFAPPGLWPSTRLRYKFTQRPAARRGHKGALSIAATPFTVTEHQVGDFAGMSAGALKTLMTERGVSTRGCFDKSQLLELAELNRDLLIRRPGEHFNFAGMKAGALKTLLTDHGVGTEGCFDREQLLERARLYRYKIENSVDARFIRRRTDMEIKQRRHIEAEVKKFKDEVIHKMVALNRLEPKERRKKEFRALLRVWHPDSNPERLEVATSVFQFLQKAKQLLDV